DALRRSGRDVAAARVGQVPRSGRTADVARDLASSRRRRDRLAGRCSRRPRRERQDRPRRPRGGGTMKAERAAAPTAWTRQRERSNRFLLVLMRWLALALGRRGARVLLHPIAC